MSQPDNDYSGQSPDESPGQNEFHFGAIFSSFFRAGWEAAVHPRQFFSSISLSRSDRDPVTFGVACLLIGGLLGTLLETLGLEGSGRSAVLPLAGFEQVQGWLQALTGGQILLIVVLVPIAVVFLVLVSAGITLFGLVIGAAIVHIPVLLFLGEHERAGIGLTIRVYSYTSVMALLSWIPSVGWIASLYGLYILYVGLRTAHKRASSGTVAAEGSQQA